MFDITEKRKGGPGGDRLFWGIYCEWLLVCVTNK
jgi:hypothetical protein